MRPLILLPMLSALAACASAPINPPTIDSPEVSTSVIWLDTRFSPAVAVIHHPSDVAVVASTREHVFGNPSSPATIVPEPLRSETKPAAKGADSNELSQNDADSTTSQDSVELGQDMALTDKVIAAWLRECRREPLSDEEYEIVHSTAMPSELKERYGDCLDLK